MLTPSCPAQHNLINPPSCCSAALQGVFVKRHQIIKEEDGSPLTPADLAVGQLITIYGRTFFVVDADTFTREWYTQQMGLQLAAPGTYPADPVDAYRQHFGLDKAPSKCHVHVEDGFARQSVMLCRIRKGSSAGSAALIGPWWCCCCTAWQVAEAAVLVLDWHSSNISSNSPGLSSLCHVEPHLLLSCMLHREEEQRPGHLCGGKAGQAKPPAGGRQAQAVSGTGVHAASTSAWVWSLGVSSSGRTCQHVGWALILALLQAV